MSSTIEPIMILRRRFLPFLPFLPLLKPLPLLAIADPRTRDLWASTGRYAGAPGKFPPAAIDEVIDRLVRQVESQRGATQTQRISDDGHRTEAHGCAGNHGAQQPPKHRVKHSGSDRDSQRVVQERKTQVLLDIAQRGARQFPGPHDPSQVSLEQRDARAFDGYVGPGTHGNPHVRRSQRWGIIYAIASHSHDSALRLQLLDDV